MEKRSTGIGIYQAVSVQRHDQVQHPFQFAVTMSQFVSKWATPESDDAPPVSKSATPPTRQGVALSKWAAALKDPIPESPVVASLKQSLKPHKKDHKHHKDRAVGGDLKLPHTHLNGTNHYSHDKSADRSHGDKEPMHRRRSGSFSMHKESGNNYNLKEKDLHHHKDKAGAHSLEHTNQTHRAHDKSNLQSAPQKHHHKHQLTLPPPSRDERIPKKPNSRAAALLEATSSAVAKGASNRRKSNDLHARPPPLTPAAKVLADRLGPVDRSDKPHEPRGHKPTPINNRLNALLDTPQKGAAKRDHEPSLASRLAQKPDPRKQREELENRRKAQAEREALEQENLLKMLDEIDTKNMDWASFED